MAITSGRVAVLTTATIIYNATAAAVVKVVNDGAIPVYLGPNTVTQDTGYPVSVGSNVPTDHTFDVPALTALYAIAKDPGAAIRFIGKE